MIAGVAVMEAAVDMVEVADMRWHLQVREVVGDTAAVEVTRWCLRARGVAVDFTVEEAMP
jgi:hypothetical protein